MRDKCIEVDRLSLLLLEDLEGLVEQFTVLCCHKNPNWLKDCHELLLSEDVAGFGDLVDPVLKES